MIRRVSLEESAVLARPAIVDALVHDRYPVQPAAEIVWHLLPLVPADIRDRLLALWKIPPHMVPDDVHRLEP